MKFCIFKRTYFSDMCMASALSPGGLLRGRSCWLPASDFLRASGASSRGCSSPSPTGSGASPPSSSTPGTGPSQLSSPSPSPASDRRSLLSSAFCSRSPDCAQASAQDEEADQGAALRQSGSGHRRHANSAHAAARIWQAEAKAAANLPDASRWTAVAGELCHVAFSAAGTAVRGRAGPPGSRAVRGGPVRVQSVSQAGGPGRAAHSSFAAACRSRTPAGPPGPTS